LGFGPPSKAQVICYSSMAVSSCNPTFFFLHPHNVMQRSNYPYFFLKNPKILIFLHYGLWNPEKFWIGISSKISDPPIHNSKYAFHIQKSIIQKKHSGSINP